MRTILLFLLVLVPGVAVAQITYPQAQAAPKISLLDYARRLQVMGIGAYDFQYAGDKAQPTTDPGKEFTVGGSASYLISPATSLNVKSVYGVDTKQVRTDLWFGYAFYGAGRQPLPVIP